MRILLFLFLFISTALADVNVRFQLQDTNNDDTYDHPIFKAGTASGTATKELVTAKQTSFGADATVYYPFVYDSDTSDGSYPEFDTASSITYENFSILGSQLPNNETGAYLRVSLYYSNASTSKELWVAYYDEDDEEYKAHEMILSGIGTVTDSKVTATITINEATKNCFNGLADCLDGANDQEYEFFFALVAETSNINVGDSISDSDDWARFTLVMGEPSFDYEDTPVVDGVTKGDSRVFLNIGSGTYIEDDYYYHTLVVNSGANGGVYSSISTSDIYYDASSTRDGTFTVKGLTNNTAYTFKVAFVDKFQFVTKFSDISASVTPENIDEFLREEACYLVSAGFGRSHYVLDYFKEFRDKVLLKTSWGKAFVRFYYRTAPDFALTIYKNPFLSGSLRAISYFVYFCFNYYLLILFIVALLTINSILSLKKNI